MNYTLQDLSTLFDRVATLERLVTSLEHSGRLAPGLAYDRQEYCLRVKAAVCRHYHLTEEELCNRSHRQEYVWPRWVAMYLMHRGTVSFSHIGKLFAGRDHSGVLYAIRSVESRMTCYPEKRAEVTDLLESLQPKT